MTLILNIYDFLGIEKDQETEEEGMDDYISTNWFRLDGCSYYHHL